MGKLLTPDDVAQRLGVSRRMALEKMKTGMRCVNVGKGQQRPRLVVDERDFERWLDQQKAVPIHNMIQAAAPKKKTAGRVVPMFVPGQPIPYRKSGGKAAK